MEVKAKQAVPLSEVKKILKKRAEESEELTYEQQQALEHAEKFAPSEKAQKEIIKKLKEIEGLPEECVVVLADIKPKKAETVKAILTKYKLDQNEDLVNEVLKTVG